MESELYFNFLLDFIVQFLLLFINTMFTSVQMIVFQTNIVHTLNDKVPTVVSICSGGIKFSDLTADEGETICMLNFSTSF